MTSLDGSTIGAVVSGPGGVLTWCTTLTLDPGAGTLSGHRLGHPGTMNP